MSLLRKVLLACLVVTALAATPAARADQWQKLTDGYWYLWNDASARWFYTDGRTWQVYQDGKWVASANPPTATTARSSNYQAPAAPSVSYTNYYYSPSSGSSGGRSWSYSG